VGTYDAGLSQPLRSQNAILNPWMAGPYADACE
jgi:hypothetical protein